MTPSEESMKIAREIVELCDTGGCDGVRNARKTLSKLEEVLK